MDEKSTGAVGILAIAVCIGVLIAAKMFFPSLFTVLLWIIGIIIALILVLIGAVIYFAFRKPKPGEEETAKSKANRIISDGRNKVMSIRRNVMSIKNTAVKNSGIKVCSGADKILGVLRQKPELVQKNRQFFTYYLPTFGSIIEKYERIERNEVASEDMVQKVLEHLDDMKIAFDHAIPLACAVLRRVVRVRRVSPAVPVPDDVRAGTCGKSGMGRLRQ